MLLSHPESNLQQNKERAQAEKRGVQKAGTNVEGEQPREPRTAAGHGPPQDQASLGQDAGLGEKTPQQQAQPPQGCSGTHAGCEARESFSRRVTGPDGKAAMHECPHGSATDNTQRQKGKP